MCRNKRQELDELVRAMDKNMGRIKHMWPTVMPEREYEAFKLAERQHAPGVSVRMNPETFLVEYFDTKTGEIIA